MKDLSELSDEELLQLTRPLADDNYIEIVCKKCGKEIVVTRQQQATKYCKECITEQKYQKHHKQSVWKSGSVGERWKLEHTL